MTASERAQIEKIVKSEQEGLLGFIRKRIGDKPEAMDIMQDVFYQLTIGFNDIRSINRITTWLLTVARNRITDYFRKKKTIRLSDIEIIEGNDSDEGPLMIEDILPTITGGPEDEYMRDYIMDTIEKSVQELPEEQKEVFVLNEFEDLSFNEISARTGVGVNTLLSRKRYAVLMLRNKLKELYNLINT
jgi:RNA polymerase sigma factor (sigma-70 family)